MQKGQEKLNEGLQKRSPGLYISKGDSVEEEKGFPGRVKTLESDG